MLKATIYLLMLLSPLASFGQNQRQWKVIKVVAVSQDTPIALTTLFTPTKDTLYRVTASLVNLGQDTWTLTFNWEDPLLSFPASFSTGGPTIDCSAALMMVAKAGAPVSYAVSPFSGTGGFELVFTVEQLEAVANAAKP
jgi:hypothetical protein